MILPKFPPRVLAVIAAISIFAGLAVWAGQSWLDEHSSIVIEPSVATRKKASRAAAPDIIDYQSWQLGFSGLGPIRAGVSLDVAASAISVEPARIGSSPNGLVSYNLPKGPKELTILVRNELVAAVKVTGRWRTYSGLAVGDPAERITELYGTQITKKQSVSDFAGEVYEHAPRDSAAAEFRVVFMVTRSGKVAAICAGKWPDVYTACSAKT